jgi:hypothetical protein
LLKNVNGVNSNISVVGYSTGQLEKVAGSILVTSEMKLTLNVYSLSNVITATKTIQAKIFATTNAITEITLTSAKSGGVIADVGSTISARGVCWSKTPGPTNDLATKTSDGSGAGAFTRGPPTMSGPMPSVRREFFMATSLHFQRFHLLFLPYLTVDLRRLL